jgi:hypothetical protein
MAGPVVALAATVLCATAFSTSPGKWTRQSGSIYGVTLSHAKNEGKRAPSRLIGAEVPTRVGVVLRRYWVIWWSGLGGLQAIESVPPRPGRPAPLP